MTPRAPRRPCSIAGMPAVVVTVLGVALAEAGAAQDAPVLPRVRSDNARIASAIADGPERSQTFRRLIDTIDATDGLVYVDEGVCGHAVRACLVLSVTLAGPYRLLRILVETRKTPGCELLEALGHELQHAIEVLNERQVRSTDQVYHFFDRLVPTDSSGTRRFETAAAIEAGFAVNREACSSWPAAGDRMPMKGMHP
jgi:hypothetical protein